MIAQRQAGGIWLQIAGDSAAKYVPPAGSLPSGWVLIECTLSPVCGQLSARLVLDLGIGTPRQDIQDLPATKKGKLRQLVWLPADLQELRFEYSPSAVLPNIQSLRLRPVGRVRHLLLMWERIGYTLLKQSRIRRERFGLTLWSAIMHHEEAYRLASRFRYFAPPYSYQDWIAKQVAGFRSTHARADRYLDSLPRRPSFHVVVVHTLSSEDPKSASTRVREQSYRNFSTTVLRSNGVTREKPPSRASLRDANDSGRESEVSEFNSRIAQTPDAYVIVLRPGDLLISDALSRIALAIAAAGFPELVYSDEDELDSEGNFANPRFKPDWSPELLRSTDYVGQVSAIRADRLLQIGGLQMADLHDGHDLLLRVSERLSPASVFHLAEVLCHRRHDSPKLPMANPEAVARHLDRLGICGTVTQFRQGCLRVKYELPAVKPRVTIIIPTRNAPRLIEQSLASVLGSTTYANFEVIVVDNQTDDLAALDVLARAAEDQRVRVLRYAKPFNYSAINNYAVAAATGEAICLLNNDTEVISPDWLDEMIGHLVQPGVAVVGAKLLYPDGRVQHAGDVVGPGGCAHHLHALIGSDDPGYCSRAILAQDLSAVTAACLVTWRNVYQHLGGLDERHLPVAFNDVDYCLRVREAGYRVIWTPHAQLYHHESVSRGADSSPEKKKRARREVAYMRKRWRRVMHHDPFYNPNLSYERPDFSLSHTPKVTKPWRK